MGRFGPAEVVIASMLLVALLLAVVGLVDAARFPGDRWQAAGHRKSVWIAVQGVGLALGILPGLAAVLLYIAFVRPALSRAGPPVDPGGRHLPGSTPTSGGRAVEESG